jgi:hypothetical protein
MRTNLLRSVVLLNGLLLAGFAYAQGVPAPLLSEAQIVVQNRADANGTIRVTLTAQGGQPMVATINVLNNMSENDIAADIEKELIVLVGAAYRVDRGGGENISIRKADREGPDFTLEIAFNTPGLSITIQD